MMVGSDGSVRTVPFRFRCQGVNEKPAEYSSHGRNNQQQPRTQRSSGFAEQGRFSAWGVGMVASYAIERKAKNDLTRRIKNDGPDTCNDAHDQRQAEHTGLGSKTLVAEFQEFREPAQRMGRSKGF